MRYPLGKIEAVFLTHYHSDHLDGLGEMATLRWIQGSHSSPLTVFGPHGVSDIVRGFNMAYSRDALYRNEHHGDVAAPLTGRGMIGRSFPMPLDGESAAVYNKGGVSIEAFRVDHTPASPAVGYRITYMGRSVVISGDTTKSYNLEQFAANVDLLVHEALAPDLVKIINRAATVTNNQNMAKITSDILNYHTTPLEAAETARDAGARHLLFYHVVPPLPILGLDAAWLDGVGVIFPNYTLGQDGTTISLPAGSRDVLIVRRGLGPI
jgi:ribonuclease Z